MHLKSNSRVLRLAVLATASLLVVGCASDDAGDSEPTQAERDAVYGTGFVGDVVRDGDPEQGGTLTYVTYSETLSLDPAKIVVAGATGGTELLALYDSLLRYDPEAGDYEPRLAEELEVDDEFRTWTLTLREEATFSDGSPVDAAAVVASFERYVAEDGNQAGLWTANVAAAEAVDERTVEITLQQGWSGFAYLLATGPGMIVGPGADDGEKFAPVGAGAFTVARFAPSEELVLEPREDHWDEAPHLEEVRFVPISGDAAKVDMLETGGADVAYLREAPVVTAARESGFGGYMDVVNMGESLLLNHRDGAATADVRVRQAIAHALDVDVWNQRVNEGSGVMSKEIFNKFSRWHSDVAALPADEDAARALLEEAKADGFDGTVRFAGVAKVSQSKALVFKALLERVGFEVEIDYAQSISDLISAIFVKRDFDVAVWGFNTPDNAVYPEIYRNFHSESASNPGGFADEEVDAILEEMRGAEEGGQQELVDRMQERWNETVPALPVGARGEFLAMGDDVRGVVASADNMLFLDEAWLDE